MASSGIECRQYLRPQISRLPPDMFALLTRLRQPPVSEPSVCLHPDTFSFLDNCQNSKDNDKDKDKDKDSCRSVSPLFVCAQTLFLFYATTAYILQITGLALAS